MGGRVLQGAVQTCPGAASQAKRAPPPNLTPPPPRLLQKASSPLLCPCELSSAAKLASGREGHLSYVPVDVSCTAWVPAGGQLGLVCLIVRPRLLTCT